MTPSPGTGLESGGVRRGCGGMGDNKQENVVWGEVGRKGVRGCPDTDIMYSRDG